MKKIISFLILVSPFICNGQKPPIDSLLLIKKGELVWLLREVDENKVLKKRVVLKDTTISTLEKDNKVLREQIKSYKVSDSTHIVSEQILSQEAVVNQQKTNIYRNENKKLRRQNTALKIVGVLITGILAKKSLE